MKPVLVDDPPLRDVAKHLVFPRGVAVASDWPDVERLLRGLGIQVDQWQDDLNYLALARTADGSMLCAEDGLNLSTPRQTGKTTTLGWMLFGLSLLRPDTLVLWTAHRLPTANETYRNLGAMARDPRVRGNVSRIAKDHGNSGVIEFHNGSRIVFGSRESGFGRGWAKVDALVLDEAQNLTEGTMEDMLPATQVSDMGLVVLAGTPPRRTDRAEVFRQARTLALDSPKTFQGVWAEFGAPDDFADTEDVTILEKVNPAVRRGRVKPAAIRRMLRRLTNVESKLREVFGVWDADGYSPDMDLEAWEDTRVDATKVPTGAPTAYALDMGPDRIAAIGVAVPGEGGTHVEIAEVGFVPFDTSGIVDWLVTRAVEHRIPVVIDAQSPAAALVPELKQRRVRVIVTTATAMGDACELFEQAVKGRQVTHITQPILDVAVTSARKRDIGVAGKFGWDRAASNVNISPLVAVTLALYGARTAPQRTNQAFFG